MRVLVTGHRGYVGSVVASVLRHARYDVVGLDCDYFSGCNFGRIQDDIPSFDTDLREVESADLLSFDAVIHLAGLSSHEADVLGADLSREINLDATVRLAECCKQANVGRFLFASTCAVYGDGADAVSTELDIPAPQTAYAQQKLAAEKTLRRMARADFLPVFLRCGTVFGVSPRLRVDTVVNDFVGSMICHGRIDMKTVGRARRPLIHVEDVARAYAGTLTAPSGTIAGEVINIASTTENYRVIDIADTVVEQFGHGARQASPTNYDKQSYRASGDKLAKLLPKHRPRWTLRRGIRQLRTAMESAGFTPSDWRGRRYRRAAYLEWAVETAQLDPELRRKQKAVA